MIALIQRVTEAEVTVDDLRVGAIGAGLLARARERHATVESGRFGAHMKVALVNDGPVTFWLETG